jgi:predicted RNase H-like nuclease
VSRVVVGADGCPAGWVVVVLADGRVRDVEVVATLDEVVDGSHDAVGVDMPVGLLDVPRDADAAARQLLPGRASSVFSAPPRTVVQGTVEGRVTTHADATALAAATTGTGLSQQAWRLVPKVAEVEALVAGGHPLLEVHPEVAFAVVVGGPLPRKRSWSGLTTRRAVLERLGLELPDRFPGDEHAAPDDVVDAAVCAWVADGAAAGEPLLTVPDRTEQVAHGRAVVITARPGPPVRPGPRRPRPARAD